MKIIIENKEYELKYSLRMYYVYEGITGKAFAGGTLLSISLLLYSALLANNNDFPHTFDQLADILDKDETTLNNFADWLNLELEKRSFVGNKKKVPKEKN